jgi:hypothetical protein
MTVAVLTQTVQLIWLASAGSAGTLATVVPMQFAQW